MTFRRLKKVNSSGPDSGAASQDNGIYFPSSKSDSCRGEDFHRNSSDVYNYRTLAYSGGTLPRNYKKVNTPKSLNFFLFYFYDANVPVGNDNMVFFILVRHLFDPVDHDKQTFLLPG